MVYLWLNTITYIIVLLLISLLLRDFFSSMDCDLIFTSLDKNFQFRIEKKRTRYSDILIDRNFMLPNISDILQLFETGLIW